MATQRLSITQLYQGTSDQHPYKRRPGQVEVAENVRFDIADGATRRNASDLLLDLDLNKTKDWYLTAFKGQYLVCIASDDLKVYDMTDGTEKAVANAAGNYSYLSSVTSQDDIRTAGLDSSLIVLNRTVFTEFDRSDDYYVAGFVTTYDKLFEEVDEGFNPVTASVGTIVETLEDWKETRAGFYEKCIDADTGTVTWVIVPPPLSDNAVPNATTLPHRLVQDTDTGEFTYEVCPWRNRLSGSDTTNPAPSWAGSTIDAIAAVQGRLAIVGDGYFTTGEVAAPRRSAFNFYDYNVDDPTDADRIDYAITDSNVGECLYAEVVGPDLALVCKNGLVVITTGTEPLTAFNGRDYTIAQFPSTEGVRPGVGAGNLFVLDDNDRINWFVYDEGIRPLGNINDHRPDILDDETVLDLFAVGQTLFVLTESGSVKVHERYVTPEGNQLSAWSELEFYEPLAFVGAYNGKVKLVTEDSTYGYTLLNYEHRRPLYLDGFEYEVCLDRREAVTGTYDGATDRTSFPHTGRMASLENSVVVVTVDADGNRLNQALAPVKVTADKVYVAGDYSNGTHYLGFRYTTNLELSKLWAGASDVMPLLSQFNTIHKETTDYTVIITVEGEIENESPWSSTRVGVSLFGEVLPETGISQHMAMGDARYTTVSIRSDSAGYFMVVAIEYRVRTRGRN